MGSTYNIAAAHAAQDQKEKEEQKLLSEAWAITVKDYPKVLPTSKALAIAAKGCPKALPASELPKRSLIDSLANNSAKASLTSCLAELSVVISLHGMQQAVKSRLVGACHVTCQVMCQVMGVTSIDVTPAMATLVSLDLAKAAETSAFKQWLSYRYSFTVSQFKLELISKCANM
jgi:hypothetical protein